MRGPCICVIYVSKFIWMLLNLDDDGEVHLIRGTDEVNPNSVLPILTTIDSDCTLYFPLLTNFFPFQIIAYRGTITHM